MVVYVDNMQASFGRMIMCHMWADSDEELLDMADKIGVQRKWIQGHPELSHGKHRLASWVHFDIAKGKRALAVKYGAVETDRFGPVEHKAMMLMQSDDTGDRARAKKLLQLVTQGRERRTNDRG